LLVGSDEAANDVVHDALTAMYRRWDTITDPGPYLNRAVLNGCRDVGRRRVADRKLVRRLRPQHDSTHDDILLDVLSRLPFNQRAAVVLRFYAGMTEREISTALDVPSGSIGPWISRALAAMNKELS
jgi:RNA polymerase sigma factor (sigma-70 family)